jgi:chemotaxis protein methyltransferase CheR
MENEEIESIELDLVLEAIHRRYGHDFRGYSKNHVQRRIKQLIARNGEDCVSSLIPKILRDESAFEILLRELSITVTQMFRDPLVFQRLRHKVIPYLRTFPFIRIWVAGCATGEEAYSLAIALKEDGLYERTTIFATDLNDYALEKAKAGIFPLEVFRKYNENYLQAGGTGSFAEYYHAKYESALIVPSLKKNLVFANHNLVTDSVFGEMHLILCRNVLIYFNPELQNRVLGLFTESLVRGGFLCLGANEDIVYSDLRHFYKRVDNAARIFQLKAAGNVS